jgi:hypothetical protein
MNGYEVKVLPYIRPVLQALPAGPDEIRWKMPHLYHALCGQVIVRLSLVQSEVPRCFKWVAGSGAYRARGRPC